MRCDIIIPAFNEELSVAKVIRDIPKQHVREVIVVDNNSSDNTSVVAENAGARVLFEKRQGYGYACLKGLEWLSSLSTEPELIVFMDADYSDHPEDLKLLIDKIDEGNDLVIGSRVLGNPEKGSLTPQQRFGNALATSLIKRFYGVHFTDLGPFRAIRYKSLMKLKMTDKTYGWTAEMQVKAAKQKLSCAEVAVQYRKRIGQSKVSGTLKGTIMAGYKILWTIFKHL